MTKVNNETISSDTILATFTDSILEGVISALEDGSIDLPGVSESIRLGSLRVARTEAARRKARRLVEELGVEHPLAFMAVLDAVELSDPGATERALKESGITLPAPTHVDEAGNPFYTSEAIADALDVPHHQVQEDIELLYEQLPELAPADGELHRIQ